MQDVDGPQLFAAYAVVVPVQMGAVTGIAATNRSGPSRSRRRTICESPATALTSQSLGPTTRPRAWRTSPAAVAVIPAVPAVVVTSFRVQPAWMSGSRDRNQDDCHSQGKLQKSHVQLPVWTVCRRSKAVDQTVLIGAVRLKLTCLHLGRRKPLTGMMFREADFV